MIGGRSFGEGVQEFRSSGVPGGKAFGLEVKMYGLNRKQTERTKKHQQAGKTILQLLNSCNS
jgi:hypothetical protein